MLPPAQACIENIEALLDEAERAALDHADGGEDAFALRETRERYLPETLEAYERIPPSLRGVPDVSGGKSPDDLLLEQLTVLQRATAAHLARCAENARRDLSANGRFLIERLGGAQPLAQAAVVAQPQEPHVFARRFIERIGVGTEHNRGLVNAIALRLHDAFPSLTQVQRGVFGGLARRVAVTVPAGPDRLRYTLQLGAQDAIETNCSKIVRGIVIRSESVGLQEWLSELFVDLRAYAQASHSTRERLESLLR